MPWANESAIPQLLLFCLFHYSRFQNGSEVKAVSSMWTASRQEDRKKIKVPRPAASRCWPLFMQQGKACAFPSASGHPDCAEHVSCCNSEYPAGSSGQARVYRWETKESKEEYVIQMQHITKIFPGIAANDGISLNLKRARYMRCSERTVPESPPWWAFYLVCMSRQAAKFRCERSRRKSQTPTMQTALALTWCTSISNWWMSLQRFRKLCLALNRPSTAF